MFERAIIIGGGTSIKQESDSGKLWPAIQDEVTIALNYAIRYFKNPTAVSYVDSSFYSVNKSVLDTYPLVITRSNKNGHVNEGNYVKLPTTGNEYYGLESLSKGVFSLKLVGLFALTVSICLGFKEIYLCGYDFGSIDGKQTTHFYQNDFVHRGVGFRDVGGRNRHSTLTYEKNPDQFFNNYIPEMGRTKIINVGIHSHISTFPKIKYEEFYRILKDNPVKVNQNEARETIRSILNGGKPATIPDRIVEKRSEQKFDLPTPQPIGKPQEKVASHKGRILN